MHITYTNTLHSHSYEHRLLAILARWFIREVLSDP
jgi:hypothetical protein